MISTGGDCWTSGAAVVAHAFPVFTVTIDELHPAVGAGRHRRCDRQEMPESSAVCCVRSVVVLGGAVGSTRG